MERRSANKVLRCLARGSRSWKSTSKLSDRRGFRVGAAPKLTTFAPPRNPWRSENFSEFGFAASNRLWLKVEANSLHRLALAHRERSEEISRPSSIRILSLRSWSRVWSCALWEAPPFCIGGVHCILRADSRKVLDHAEARLVCLVAASLGKGAKAKRTPRSSQHRLRGSPKNSSSIGCKRNPRHWRWRSCRRPRSANIQTRCRYEERSCKRGSNPTLAQNLCRRFAWAFRRY